MQPFYNKDFEHIGTTVQYVDAGLDTGDIILQAQPEWDAEDNTHTIGCKLIELSADLMCKVIAYQLKHGHCPAEKQVEDTGISLLKKDFTEEVLEKIEENIRNGMIKDYAKNPKKLDLVFSKEIQEI